MSAASLNNANIYNPDEIIVPAYHLIGGRSVRDGSTSIGVQRPSDGKVHGDLPCAGAEQINQAVAAAQRAFPAWSKMKPRARGKLLRRWADLIDSHREELSRLESVVSSRPYTECMVIDISSCGEYVRYFSEYADKLEGYITSTGQDALSLVMREPYGPVAIITPWNFPMVLTTWKIAPAIAAGNTVVVKPSEMTPFAVTRLAELALEAGIPEGVINIVHGTGHNVGPALTRHPGIAYVSFTGSTAVGGKIMADVGQSGLLKPVCLELGGKSPVVVFDDVENLDEVADHVTWGITRNAGQLCYAGSRLVVQKSIADALVDRVATRMTALETGTTWQRHTRLPPVISAKQAERMDRLVNVTLKEGAACRLGGKGYVEGGANFFEPTILTNVNETMTAYREEVFGPVLVVQTFDGETDAIARAQHPEYGLTASVFSSNGGKALRVARNIHAGTIWINRWGRTIDMISSPFGGYGSSGFGKESGRLGIENFTRQKAVWIEMGDKVELAQSVGPEGERRQ